MIHGSGLFAPAVEVADDVSTQTRLLALLGRREQAPMRANELGHVGLYVRDLDASVRFYRDVLGFQEAGRVPGAAFLAAGRTHHELR